MRRRLLAIVAATGLAGGAGLCLAQDNTVAPPPPPAEASDANVQSAPAASSDPLQAPPAEDAPAPPPTPSSPEPSAPAPAPAANTVANAVDEAPAPPPPPMRPRYPSVVLQALDKVTAETLRFEAKVDEPVRYKDLVITVRACETQATDEPYRQTAAHLEVQYQPEVSGGRTPTVARQVYRGWMFADSPGLNPLEHPIYDVWVIACKAAPPAPPSAAAAPPPAPKGASL